MEMVHLLPTLTSSTSSERAIRKPTPVLIMPEAHDRPTPRSVPSAPDSSRTDPSAVFLPAELVELVPDSVSSWPTPVMAAKFGTAVQPLPELPPLPSAPESGDVVPTVRIRNRKIYKLWYRGPRLNIRWAYAWFALAIVLGAVAGVCVRKTGTAKPRPHGAHVQVLI